MSSKVPENCLLRSISDKPIASSNYLIIWVQILTVRVLIYTAQLENKYYLGKDILMLI